MRLIKLNDLDPTTRSRMNSYLCRNKAKKYILNGYVAIDLDEVVHMVHKKSGRPVGSTDATPRTRRCKKA